MRPVSSSTTERWQAEPLYDSAPYGRIHHVATLRSLPDFLPGSQSLIMAANEPLTPETLCARYAERVYRFAAMVGRGSAEAEDVAQEALERAIRKLDQFDRRRGTVESWLFRIVVRTAADAHRVANRRFALWERLLIERSTPAAVAEDVEAAALAHMTDEEVLAAVRRLRPRDRAVIALRFGADLEHADIGASLGLSANAAGVAVRRALARLRTLLEEQKQWEENHE
jgi:RNA polymerase sigma factor (sigma-70 family)